MNLTYEQVQAIRGGAPVPIVPPEVGEECVLVRRDVYERAQGQIEKELPGGLAVSRMMADVSGDEDLDFYQQYKR